jgi:hypothetical protein
MFYNIDPETTVKSWSNVENFFCKLRQANNFSSGIKKWLGR